MILICEQCQARYLLASLLLGAEGRTVKCGVCSHTWYQPPADEVQEVPGSFRDHLDIEMEPIPEGVRPIPEGSAVPALPREKFKFNFKPKIKISRESVGGGAAAAAVFVLVFAGMVLFHNPLGRAWPPINLMFNAIGLETALPGEGLVFDQVAAKATPGADGKFTLTVSGNVVNLKKSDVSVPTITASLQKDGEDSGTKFSISAEESSIDAEGKVPFTATYENLADDVTDVKVTFAAK